jgi:hypothetical protein
MYARIQHGVVADVRQTHPKGFFVDEFAAQFVTVPDDVGNGWTFDGSTYTPPPAPYVPTKEELDAIAAEEAERVRLASVPQSVTMRQARLALLGAGMLPAVNAAINAMTGAQKEAAAIEWEYSQSVDRHRGLVLALGTSLGLDALAMDNMFIAASKL